MSSVDLAIQLHNKPLANKCMIDKWNYTESSRGSDTYDFDAVAWSGGECPGACLLAGVFIRPIGAGDGAAHTIHSVITASCKKTSPSQHTPLYHADTEQSNT